MGLTRRERVADLRELHGAAWVESPAEMLGRMTTKQRACFNRLRSEQAFLIERHTLSPRLDRALADVALEPRVAYALANRTLMRRALRGI